MFYLEILSNQHYQKLSDKNRIHSRLSIPLRGVITDRQGKLLASNHNVYRAVMIRNEAEDWRASLRRFQEILGISEEEMDAFAKNILRRPKFMPVSLKENLSWDDLSLLELHLPDLSGIV